MVTAGSRVRDPAKFGAETTASEVAEGIDLSGKVALITGGSSGLGQETTRVLAERGAHVILTARDMSKGEAVAAGIRASTGNQHVEVEELELGSLKDIRAFVQRFLARHPTLHILVNNAGVMACPPAKTTDGFELQFGSNHLGHFLTTCLLAPALRRAAPSRVVSVSSAVDGSEHLELVRALHSPARIRELRADAVARRRPLGSNARARTAASRPSGAR